MREFSLTVSIYLLLRIGFHAPDHLRHGVFSPAALGQTQWGYEPFQVTAMASEENRSSECTTIICFLSAVSAGVAMGRRLQ